MYHRGIVTILSTAERVRTTQLVVFSDPFTRATPMMDSNVATLTA